MTIQIQTADQICGRSHTYYMQRIAADQVEILHYRLGLHPDSQELRDAYQQAQAVLAAMTPTDFKNRPAWVQEPLDRWAEWDELWAAYRKAWQSLGDYTGAAHDAAMEACRLIEDQLRNFGVIHRAYLSFWTVEVQPAEMDLGLPNLFSVTHTYRDGPGQVMGYRGSYYLTGSPANLETVQGALGRYNRQDAPNYAQGILAWLTDYSKPFPVL